jgi:type IV pilus assembly protein PilP
MIALLTACNDAAMTDLHQYVDTVHKNKKPLVEPLPEMPTYKPFDYNSDGLQNPFDIVNVAVATATISKPDAGRKQQPLEGFSLDTLKFVGTIKTGEKPWVLVRADDGFIYRATVGDYMGKNEGKILLIDLKQQKMILSELVPDSGGVWVRRRVEININDK